MPRRPRFVVPGIPHHITQRGNDRQDVFFSDHDRARYLELLSDQCSRHDVRMLGWCLMTNHVHLIAVPRSPESLAVTLGQAHAQYALEINRAQRRVGHLWQNRFFSCPLDTRYLFVAMLYVDLNPVRAGMVGDALEWEWSSARAHADVGEARCMDSGWREWMEETRVGWDGEAWREAMAAGLAEDLAERVRRGTRVGEPCGEEEFLLGGKRGQTHFREPPCLASALNHDGRTRLAYDAYCQ